MGQGVMTKVHLTPANGSSGSSGSSRRAFCKQGLLAGAAVLLKPAYSARGAIVPVLSAADEAALRFVAAYSSACFLQGGCVLGAFGGTPSPVTYLVAEVTDRSAFARAWQRPPAANVYANGNVFSFVRPDGVFFAVEHLLPADYAARQLNLAAGRGIRFAHEALTFTPATRAISDPFGVVNRTTVAILPGIPVAEATAVVLEGILAAALFDLAPGSTLNALKHQTLAAASGLAVSERNAVSTFIALLPALAAVKPAGTIKQLAGMPLLETGLSRVYGSSAGRAAAGFDQLRASTSPDFSDGAVWLAAVLGKIIRQGNVGIDLASNDSYVAWQARTALDQTRKIIQQQQTQT
jgi:hypothetical protein